MHTTIKDIANILNVSPATVSLALNDKPGVSSSLRKKIIETAIDLNYIVKRTNIVYNVTYIVYMGDQIDNDDWLTYRTLFWSAIHTNAKVIGFNVQTEIVKEDSSLPKTLRTLAAKTDGIIFLGARLDNHSRCLDILEKINQTICPVVILSADMIRNFELDCVTADNLLGSMEAVEYLIHKGHRRIGYLISTRKTNNCMLREYGVDQAIRESNDASLIKVPVGSSNAEAKSDIQKWLDTKPELPTAFFADSDIIAFAAMQVFAKNQIKIPEDVSLIGYGNMREGEYIIPSLTSVYVLPDHLCKETLILLQRRIQEFRSPKSERNHLRVVFPTHIVERDSVRDLRE